MKISNDTRLLLQILRHTYPWARYVSRSRGDVTRSVGALRLHETMPEATEKGFVPTGWCVELPPEFLPEVPEGVMVGIETLMESEVKNDDRLFLQ